VKVTEGGVIRLTREEENLMSRTARTARVAALPETLRVDFIRIGLALAVAASLLAFAVRSVWLTFAS
jgi:hypothetical protein